MELKQIKNILAGLFRGGMYQLNIFRSKIHSLGTLWRPYKCMYGVCVFLALDFYLVGSPTVTLIWDNEKKISTG